MIKIAVWNMKGGVGKTTSSFNLAAEYAAQGRKVLCVDLDIQANLTSFFEKDIHTGTQDISQVFENKECLKKAVRHSRHGIDFIAGSNRKINVTDIRQLGNALQETAGDYDICVIDCHPDSSLLSENALAIADMVLIPVLLDGFSRDNLNLVISELIHVEDVIGHEIRYGVFVNRVRNLKSQKVIFGDLIKEHDYPVLETSVSDYAGIQTALLMQKPLRKHRKLSQAALDFKELAAEIMEMMENTETVGGDF